MALITILIVVFVERLLGSLEELRRFDWLVPWVGRLQGRFIGAGAWQGPVAVLLAVGLPLLAVGFAYAFLERVWAPLAFVFSIVVLLYSLGPRDLEAEVEAFIDARARGDEESAGWHAAELIGDIPPEDGRGLTRRVIQSLLIEAHERLLGVIFWFIVLGPIGALLYRLGVLLRQRYGGQEDEFGAAAERLHHILAWLPARLCGWGYALSGSFVEAMHTWRSDAERWGGGAQGVLIAAGFGALRFDPFAEEGEEYDAELETSFVVEAMALVRRTVFVWLAILALFTLAGWAT